MQKYIKHNKTIMGIRRIEAKMIFDWKKFIIMYCITLI